MLFNISNYRFFNKKVDLINFWGSSDKTYKKYRKKIKDFLIKSWFD